MDATKSVLNGAAFLCGIGVELFGATDKVLEVGHYTANGLRKAADAVDWVTDKAQTGCRAGQQHFRDRQEVLNAQRTAYAANEEFMNSFFKQDGKVDIEDAEFVDVTPKGGAFAAN